MSTKTKRKKKKMGRSTVDIEIANNDDVSDARRGRLDPAKIRRKTIAGAVDSGAVRLILPLSLVKELGLPIKDGTVSVRYADGRRAKRSEADQVRVHIMGRDGLFDAIIEPKRDTALIGAVVLERLDFLVDCTNQRLVPRDPNTIVSEIEQQG